MKNIALPNLENFIVITTMSSWKDRLILSGEQGEIYTTIFTVLKKAGVGCKGVVARVF